MLHTCQMFLMIYVVLIGHKTGAIAWFDVTTYHLHFLGSHFHRALRLSEPTHF